jgi:hypothetical protein
VFDGRVSEVTAAVEAVGVPVSGEDLAALVRVRDVLDAKVSAGIGEVDAAELWDADDAVSMSGWLRQPLRSTHEQAGRQVGRARKLRAMAATRAAWQAGRLSSAQVDAIVAVVTAARLAAYLEAEAEMVDQLAGLDGPDTVAVLKAWAGLIDDLLAPDPADVDPDGDDEEGDGELWASRTLDGRVEISGTLAGQAANLVLAALRAAQVRDSAGGPVRSPAQARASALADIAKFFLDHHDHPNPTPRNRPHVGVVIDWDALRTRGQGRLIDADQPVGSEDVQQVLCDAGVFRVLTVGRSTVLDLGRTTKVISPAQHAALAVRDGGCRWPGCDRPASWCDAHHIEHWITGGPTALGNLVLLCRRHHRRIHRRGVTAKLDTTDATLTITLANGHQLTSRPRITAGAPAPPR